MSVRFDASADALSRTANLPAYPISLCGWFKVSVDGNQVHSLFSFGNSGTGGEAQTFADFSGSTAAIMIYDGNASATGSNVLTVGTWFHFGLVIQNPTDAQDDLLGYLNGVLAVTNADMNDGIVTGGANTLRVGNNRDSEFINGCAAAIKIYSGVQLTAAEFAAEMRQYVPVRWENLNAWYPLWSAADVADYSANGYAWTVGGTLATEEGPPIPWRYRRKRQSIYVVSAAGGPTGSAAITEAGDAPAASGSLVITGTSAVTEAGDSPAASGLAGIRGSVAVTEAEDSPASSGLEVFTGAAAVTEAGDTPAGAGLVIIAGTAAITEADDSPSATGLAGVRGPVAVTEADDSPAASGVEIFTGTSAVTEAGDTPAASGLLTITGASAVAEAGDSPAGSGLLAITGTGAVTEAGDAVSAFGVFGDATSGVVIVTEADDAPAASGSAGIRGPVAVTEADDAPAASGLFVITGSVTTAEAGDTVAASGLAGVAGSAAIAEAGDAAVGAGTVTGGGGPGATSPVLRSLIISGGPSGRSRIISGGW